jgi:flagellin-like protein
MKQSHEGQSLVEIGALIVLIAFAIVLLIKFT